MDVFHQPHVTKLDNTLVTLVTAIHANTAHKEQDTSSELTEVGVIESDKLVTAFPDSMRTHGNVQDAHQDKEDQTIRELVKHLPHVMEAINILVSTMLLIVVLVEHAQQVQDGLSDKTDSDATE
jgi:hypothetical protein